MTDFISTITRPGFLRKFTRLLILATLITASIIIIPKVTTPSPAVDSKMLAVRMLFAGIIILTVANWKSVTRPPRQLTDFIFGGLVLSFVCSLLFSGRIGYCIVEGWHFGGFFCLGWIIYRIRPTANECRMVVRIAAILGLIAGLYGFLAFIGYDILKPLYPFTFEEVQAGGRNFVHSFYGNPEYFGGFAAPTAALLFGFGLQPGIGIVRRFAWIGSSVFLLGTLALSGSRGAFIGFVFGAAIIFIAQIGFLSRRMRRACWAAVGAAIVVLAAGLVILSTPNPLNTRDMRLAQRFENVLNTRSASVRERLLFYTSTAMAIPINPVFGYGPGAYRLEFFNNVKLLVENDQRGGTTILLKELQRRLAEHTHNDYLEFWFEFGTIGIALILLLIVHASVRFSTMRWRIKKLEAPPRVLTQNMVTSVTLFGAITTIYINALTSFPFHMPARGVLVWTLTGAFFAMDRILHEAIEVQSGKSDDNTETPKVDHER